MTPVSSDTAHAHECAFPQALPGASFRDLESGVPAGHRSRPSATAHRRPLSLIPVLAAALLTALRSTLLALASSAVCALTGLMLLLAQDGYVAVVGTPEGIRAALCGAGLVGMIMGAREVVWGGVRALSKVLARRDVAVVVERRSAAEVEGGCEVVEDPMNRRSVFRRRGTGCPKKTGTNAAGSSVSVQDGVGWDTEADASEGLSPRMASKIIPNWRHAQADGVPPEHKVLSTLVSLIVGCFAPAVGVAVLGRTERVDVMHAFTLCMTGAWMLVGFVVFLWTITKCLPPVSG